MAYWGYLQRYKVPMTLQVAIAEYLEVFNFRVLWVFDHRGRG